MLNQLFSTYHAANTPVHKMPLWLKWLLFFSLAVATAGTQSWLVPAVLLALTWRLGGLAGITTGEWLAAVWTLKWLLLAMSLYYILAQKIERGADIILTLVTLIFASKILLRTTEITTLIDGLVRFCRPLKYLGISPDLLGLAIALMIRSIPVIMDRWLLLQAAVAARGLKVSPVRLFTPLVITTVAYAQETGDALVARGLDSPHTQEKTSSSNQ